MKANKIIEVLDNFKESNYQKVLIDGNWGIGKTKYVSDFIQEDESNGCYISLFGKRDIESVIQEIYFHIIAQDSTGKLKKYMSILRQKTKALDVSYFGISLSVPLIENLHKTLKKELGNKKEYIIILDDLERKHDELDIKEVFGLVDSLSKIKDIKVVLIAATMQFNTNNDENFKEYREKAIDRIYSIEEYADEAPVKIMGAEIWQVIEPLVKQFNFKNLRTFEKTKLFIEEVMMILDQKVFTEKFTKADLYRMCFATVFFKIEHKSEMILLESESESHIKKFQNAQYKGSEKGEVDYLYSHILKNSLDNAMNKNTLKYINKWYKTGAFSKENLIKQVTSINNYEEKATNFYSSQQDIIQMIDYTRDFLMNLSGSEPLEDIVNKITTALDWCDALSMEFGVSNKEIITLARKNIINHIDLEQSSFHNEAILIGYIDNTRAKDLVGDLQQSVKLEYFQLLMSKILVTYENRSYKDLIYLRQLNESIVSITDTSVRINIVDTIKKNDFLFPAPIGKITSDQWFWCTIMNMLVRDIQLNWQFDDLYESFESSIQNREDSALYQYRIRLLIEKY